MMHLRELVPSLAIVFRLVVDVCVVLITVLNLNVAE
jgi:hypothetical protein